ncbi:hypothetical protein Bpfe_005140 [Biomphalaria pfeifferi]|uniref:Uncharacterized protein n=1 Tax=Biomphalaria pfeifferi TaxID=112525 RepID=A0AAD8C4H8_BIOPF|nr:hypothetical protein Bpfe_005140 [Biomphalaria pfeifferi]
MAVTRSQTYVHLIGEPVQLFNGNMLPTTREVLQVYYHHHNNEKLSKTESITVTVREVCEIWARARVPSAEERNIIHKLKLLVDKHRTVCRNKTRGGTAQMARESNFEADMNGLFDIAHHDVMNRIKIEEDRVFLVDQRTERKYVMGKIDQQLTAVEGRRAVRIQREAELRTKEDRRLNDLAQASAPASASLNNGDTSDISDLDEESSAELSDYNPECKSSDSSDTQDQTQQKRAKISANEAVSPQLAAALYCTSVSNRDAAYILHAAATTYGQNASGMSLSVSSIRRTRSKRHIQAAGDVKSAFNRDGPLVIHFVGKLLPSIAGGPGKEDRVAIIVTGHTTEKLLAIPKVVQGTGEQIAKAAAETITDWELTNSIAGMSFDTTAANTDHLNGTCVLLEQKLGKELLWLACRHHILELLCSDIFKKVFGPTSGPNVILFRRFQELWPNIDQVAYKPCADTLLMTESLAVLKQEILKFCQDILTAEVKTRMASCLITASEHETSSESSIKYTGKEELGDEKLDYFIGSRSHFFFQVLNLDKLLLNLPVEQWPQLKAYLHAKVVAHSLKVVNDSAERGIALATNFNKSLTKKEDEKQYLYQVVESHRKQYPDAKKATLNQ